MSTEKKPIRDELIEMQRDIITSLKKQLEDPELTVSEKTLLSNSVAYHISVLNKMLNQNGQSSQYNDQTLADFVKNMDASVNRIILREFKLWTKKLLPKKQLNSSKK